MSTAAQNDIRIIGKVFDNAQMEAISANMLGKGTTIGAITNVNGEYTITVPNEKAVLVFSFIGYQKPEIAVGKNRVISVRFPVIGRGSRSSIRDANQGYTDRNFVQH